MIEGILFGLYVMGYLWFVRYHIGWFIDDFGVFGPYRDMPDGVGLALAFFMGALAGIIWPLTVGYRGVAIAFSSVDPPKFEWVKKAFPVPSEIESRAERKARENAEAR